MNRVRVKICCIVSTDEARLAIAAGADAIGFVSAMPSGPGTITDQAIAKIARTVPPPVGTFLLTCSTEPPSAAGQVRSCGCNTIQLCDAFALGRLAGYDALRGACMGVRIVQVIHVEDERAIAEAVRVAPHVDAILLDSGRPSAAVPELGGTGRTHDWTISKRIREEVNVPIYLAGGLNADNVREAIETVHPFAVDVCSGVRQEGKLAPEKLEAFFKAVNAPL